MIKNACRVVVFLMCIMGSVELTAQQIDRNIYEAIKSGDVEYLSKQSKQMNLNTCYDLKGSQYTPLIVAIKLNSIGSFNHFLAEDIDIEKQCTGKTPLQYAIKYGRIEMVKLLLANEANSGVTASGKSALQYAKKYKQKKIVELLESKN